MCNLITSDTELSDLKHSYCITRALNSLLESLD